MRKELKIILPKVCPYKLIRIGGTKDGAYLIPDDLDGIKHCFSPGVNQIKDFEDELAFKYGICSHMCDFSTNLNSLKTNIISSLQTFDKKWLDPSSHRNNISLDKFVNKYARNKNDDLILQIDIEGSEYINLLSTSEKTLNRFRIIAIEFHGFKNFKTNKYKRLISPTLHKLDKNHVCVHAHANNCCGDYYDKDSKLNIPDVIELTFLRRDRFLKKSIHKMIQPIFMNELDIRKNVDCLDELNLNKNWFNSKFCKSIKRNINKLDILNYRIKYLQIKFLSIFGLTAIHLKRQMSATKQILKKLKNSIKNS